MFKYIKIFMFGAVKMSVTLSGKNSKFANALASILDESILEIIEFDHAVISDDGNSWMIYFNCFGELTAHATYTVEKAVKTIAPPSVNVLIDYTFINKEEPEEVNEVPDFSAPDFDDSDAPNEDEGDTTKTLEDDVSETAMDRYRKRQTELSQEAAEKAKSYEGKQQIQKKKQEDQM